MNLLRLCDALQGWIGCQTYVAEGAIVTVSGATYDLHAFAYGEKARTTIFFATYHAKYSGADGPAPPTHK